MGFAQAPTPPHLYPQSIQLKLYQAFIFSIPILFSIILFLLFYLFYLKRRTISSSNLHPTLPRSLPSSDMGLKGNFKEKLPIILFDEELRTRESMCCVCLGEFELKEELHEIPPCRHVFHIDCIRYWLHSNPTCPLCRCFIIVAKPVLVVLPPQQQPLFAPHLLASQENHNTQMITSSEQQQQQQVLGIDRDDVHVVVTEEESSSSSRGCSHQDSVVISIENHP